MYEDIRFGIYLKSQDVNARLEDVHIPTAVGSLYFSMKLPVCDIGGECIAILRSNDKLFASPVELENGEYMLTRKRKVLNLTDGTLVGAKGYTQIEPSMLKGGLSEIFQIYNDYKSIPAPRIMGLIPPDEGPKERITLKQMLSSDEVE